MVAERAGAESVAIKLRRAGFQAYFAGGCVRDLLLGKAPKDWDVTTDARPEEVALLFPRTLLVGAAFGVVRVVLGKGREYEVATFRHDGEYLDGRRPQRVHYSKSWQEDVVRRDFTINAMLMDPESQEVLDIVGGRSDLEAGLIRAVGDPEQRFAEDRLRMLRAVRFATRFGFRIEDQTSAAIGLHAKEIGAVSVERIVAELEAIWGLPAPHLGMTLLAQTGLLPHVLPFSFEPAKFLRLPPGEDKLAIAWALVTENLPESELEPVLRRYKLSNQQVKVVLALARAKAALLTPGMAQRRLAASPEADRYLAFASAWLGEHPAVDHFSGWIAEYRQKPLPARPLLGGAELMALGMAPGPEFKAVLEAVDDAVLLRQLTEKTEALAWVRQGRPALAQGQSFPSAEG